MRIKRALQKGSYLGNRKASYKGMIFDSERELRRYIELELMEKAGAISDLQTQVRFELIPAQYAEVLTGEHYKRGEKKGQPKTKKVCIEKSVDYVADFVYMQNGERVVEDAKGHRTEKYIIKRKLMLWVHGIRVKES